MKAFSEVMVSFLQLWMDFNTFRAEESRVTDCKCMGFSRFVVSVAANLLKK